MPKKRRCQVCKHSAAITVSETPTRMLCLDCFIEERDQKRALIDQLIDVADVKPPLGYKFIDRDWYKNERFGKAAADAFYSVTYGVIQ